GGRGDRGGLGGGRVGVEGRAGRAVGGDRRGRRPAARRLPAARQGGGDQRARRRGGTGAAADQFGGHRGAQVGGHAHRWQDAAGGRTAEGPRGGAPRAGP